MTAVKASAARAARPTLAAAVRPSTFRQRIVASTLWAVIRIVRLLPEAQVHRVAHVAGAGLYLIRPRRRALVRANLRRICTWLVEHDRASPTVAAAVRDDRRMEALVRDAFGHYVRAYAEAAIAPAGASALSRGVAIESPDVVADALRQAEPGGDGRLVIGLHFGALELAARYAVVHGRVPVSGPMETIGDAALQDVILRARSATGVRLLPLGTAAGELATALARDEIVALVGDRVVRGAGTSVDLFGARARLPIGPAVLAYESGCRVYLVAVRRTGWARYAARMRVLDVPRSDPRRLWTRAFLDAEARVFESFIGDAPEQWWTIFFPIWDEPRDAATGTTDVTAASSRAGSRPGDA